MTTLYGNLPSRTLTSLGIGTNKQDENGRPAIYLPAANPNLPIPPLPSRMYPRLRRIFKLFEDKTWLPLGKQCPSHFPQTFSGISLANWERISVVPSVEPPSTTKISSFMPARCASAVRVRKHRSI